MPYNGLDGREHCDGLVPSHVFAQTILADLYLQGKTYCASCGLLFPSLRGVRMAFMQIQI